MKYPYTCATVHTPVRRHAAHPEPEGSMINMAAASSLLGGGKLLDAGAAKSLLGGGNLLGAQKFAGEVRLMELFREIDSDGSGSLERDEVAQLSKKLGRLLTPVELNEAMMAMDGDGSNSVDMEEFKSWWRGEASKDSSWAALIEEAEYLEMIEVATLDEARELCQEASISPVPDTLELMVTALKRHYQPQGETLIYVMSDGTSSDHVNAAQVRQLEVAGIITDTTLVWWKALDGWTEFGKCKTDFAPEFMDAENKEIEALFRDIDDDGSGTLDSAEVMQLSMNLGKVLTAAELDEAMTSMDADGNNSVDLDEFKAWWRAMKTSGGDSGLAAAMEEADERVEALFNEIDDDGSGTLDSDEVAQLSKNLGKLLTDAELDKAMKEMDDDGNNSVDLVEFKVWWRSMKNRGPSDSGFAAIMEEAEYLEILEDATEEDAVELCEEAGISPIPETHELMIAALKRHYQPQGETLVYAMPDGTSSDHVNAAQVRQLVAEGVVTDNTFVWWKALDDWTEFGKCKTEFAPEFMHAEQRRVETLFRNIDEDGSGTLDRDEVAKLSHNLGKALTAAELDEAMKSMDADGNNSVDLDEFKAWWSTMKTSGADSTFAEVMEDAETLELIREASVEDARELCLDAGLDHTLSLKDMRHSLVAHYSPR